MNHFPPLLELTCILCVIYIQNLYALPLPKQAILKGSKDMIHKKLVLVSLLAISCSSTALYAAGNSNSPNGKPFVEIQEQFTEVNTQIASIEEQMEQLIGRVDTLEERVTVNEAATLSLEEKNNLIDQQISELIAQTGENSANIISALQQIMTIRSQIGELYGLTGDNSADIATLEQQLSDLETYVEQNAAGILALESEMSNNAALIEALRSDIEAIEEELAKKQDILSGKCPVGSSLSAISPEGGISCEYDNHASGLRRVSVRNYVYVPGRTPYTYSYSCGFLGLSTCYGTRYGAPQSRKVIASCPTGTVVVGGSATSYYGGLTIIAQYIYGNGYYASARNDGTTGRYLYSNATCLSLY